MKHIKLFENFSREYLKANNNSLVAAYADKLGDFWLEEELIKKLEQFESKVDTVFSDNWNLNRGRSYSNHSGDYFAISVKVYNYPNEDEVHSKLGIELDEEKLSDIWYRWLQDQAEMFQEDIDQSYDWVKLVSWGGNSGGWVHIHPDNGADQLLEYAEETIQDYLDTKEYYDEETISSVANAINSAEWKRLSELGLVEDEDEVKDIADKLNAAIKWFDDEYSKLNQIEEDLTSIQNQYREFDRNSKQYFLDYLAEEIADGHISESLITQLIKTEGTIDTVPGIKVLISKNESIVGSVSLLNLNDSNKNEFDSDLVDFLNDEPGPFTNNDTYYLHSMAVAESHRGQGLSKHLLTKCHEIANTNGIKHIILITNCDNTVAQNLYSQFGYAPCNSTGLKDLLVKNLF